MASVRLLGRRKAGSSVCGKTHNDPQVAFTAERWTFGNLSVCDKKPF
jgi:hypothetical protein